MSNALAVSVTDELVAELEKLASNVGAMALDTAEEVEAQNGRMIECPVCSGEGYASAENDYCNFDNHAIGVEFYGIGSEFGLAEAYFRKASPTTILALLAERAELKRDAERYRWLRDRIENKGDMVIAKCSEWSIESWSGDDPDAAIDAAMQS